MPDEAWFASRYTVKEFKQYEGWVSFKFYEDIKEIHIPKDKIKIYPFMKIMIKGKTIDVIGKRRSDRNFPEIQSISFNGERIYQRAKLQ